MRKTFRRTETNQAYWDRRWTEAGSDADLFASLDIYPIKYAQRVMLDPRQRALELGCGLGRVVKHYHHLGWPITGLERSPVAVERMKAEVPDLDVQLGDALALPFADASFDVLMAFGLFHNLEDGLPAALAETQRVLKPGGRFCITMRPDNVEMRLNEHYWRWRNRARTGPLQFHKWLVDDDGFRDALAAVGLRTRETHHARNLSMLYRLPFLRARGARSETENRAAGYRLNPAGQLLDDALMRWFAPQACNVTIFIGERVR